MILVCIDTKAKQLYTTVCNACETCSGTPHQVSHFSEHKKADKMI